MNVDKNYTVSKQSVEDLYQMLQMMRPAFGTMDKKLIGKYILPLGCTLDDYGNASIRIGDAPVMWSCHTDTVHHQDGYQAIVRCNETNRLRLHKRGGYGASCLGADDTTGVWLMREMIKAKRPGLYVFHRAEEGGRKGSRWIVDQKGEKKMALDDIKFCIALDRKGTDSVITFQMGSRCCSDEFGLSLASKLGMAYKLDDGGSYTDSASYVDVIGECTNLSVGYYGQHGSGEELDLLHLIRMREALLEIDTRDIVVKRKPGEKEAKTYRTYNYRGRGGYHGGYMEGDDYHGYGFDNYSRNVVDYRHYHDTEELVKYGTISDTYGYYVPGKSWSNCTKEQWDDENHRRSVNRYRLKVNMALVTHDEWSKLSHAVKAGYITDKKEDKKTEKETYTGGIPQDNPAQDKFYRMRDGRPVLDTVLDLVVDYPDEVANMLKEWGFGVAFLREEILERERKMASSAINKHLN